MAAVLLALLTACTEDADDGQRQTVTFEVKAGTTVYTEQAAGARSMSPFSTRDGEYTPPADWMPSSYTSFNNLNRKFLQQKNLVNASIDIFFTKNENFTSDDKNWQEGTFFYLASMQSPESKWRLDMDITAGDYYLYGFIPEEDAASANIAPNSTFSNGAVLTINDLNTVTPSDVCVVVGAKESIAPGDKAEVGKFKVHANTAMKGENESGAPNYIFLLFDHLYTALRFNFTIDATYDALRTIKLRKLEMRACNNDFTEYVSEHCNATVTLEANENGNSPVKSVSFSNYTMVNIAEHPDEGFKEIYKYVEGSSNEVVLEHGDSTEFLGCLTPGISHNLQLRSTYDVYDKNITPEHPKGNLIRKGCQAVNNLKIAELFAGVSTLQPGKSYSLTMTVMPTYLYMLSEPDLESPTLDVER